jgi:hypothetical protein
MGGWLYRRAVDIKELGERAKIRFLIVVGLRMRDAVSRKFFLKAL